MKLSSIKRLFGGKPLPEPRLVGITSERTGERTLLGVENLLSSIAVPEPFSLEIAGDAAGVTLLARCREGSFVKQQLGAHYPQARVNEVSPEDDPLRLAEGEQAWSMNLRLKGPEYLPLRTFRDDDLRDQGSDPLISVIGSMSGLRDGERLVARLKLLSLGPEWARHHQEKAERRQRPDPANNPQNTQAQIDTKNGVNLAILGVVAFVGLRGYLWIQDGETWKAVLLGLGTAAALTLAGWAWWRIRKALSGGKHRDPLLIKEKTSRIAYEAQLEIIAILPEDGSEDRARELLRNAALAYRGYDNPAGASFKTGKIRPAIPVTEPFPPARGMLQARNVLGARELAALWHPLGGGDQLAGVPRSGARVLHPTARAGSSGAYVGDTASGRPQEIHFQEDTLHGHHFYVARTRMGKSTLMLHIVEHLLLEKAAGRNGDAIIVIDPHADLVADILKRVPEEIIDQVYLIDLADEERAPGINLLDARVFADRDRTADSVVRIAHGLWEQWGPRMQSILDGQRLLADLAFRKQVLRRVADPYILDWWDKVLPTWDRETRSQALAPVQTRLAYYSSSKKARAILGQPRSTIDLRRVIAEGGVLLVSTSQSKAGRDVSALVGASLLNLVDAVIREQGGLPTDQRRGALVVVDEMQSIPGVDYESMLSELGKFGASFVLATQSLARLAELSPTMQDTLLANVSCLAVFQVAASDARQLIGELDRGRVDEEDLVSLPVHHCYVRATTGGQRLPTFTLAVRKPGDGDPQIAQRIKDLAWAYTTPADALASLDAEAEERVREFRENLEDSGDDGSSGSKPVKPPGNSPPNPTPNGAAGEAAPGRRRRDRRKGGATPEQTTAAGGNE